MLIIFENSFYKIRFNVSIISVKEKSMGSVRKTESIKVKKLSEAMEIGLRKLHNMCKKINTSAGLCKRNKKDL